ncbi:MAG: hypothetical protein A3G18_08655 [Rhodospirillales bacterium RIFCSPLOWO2_12_FULL_58_28]|nr:MAG: hypothetical protein A3H92_00210 [Rhodospirillales bacterium RIFCSPLOWO2_02_FULL_58_16]OHC79767.1 MAG: hypothetical protein A3G18_08655 [Rhodospirillales bacterium RIFCSPLOWO2_12_FULL_58_28]
MRIAIIPARSGSTRIKDKNIHPFCGKPLCSYPMEAARESGLFDMIHLSTDSQRYADTAAGLGFPVDFLRDQSLSRNDSSMMEMLRWVLERYDEKGQVFNEVCMVYATSPLIDGSDIAEGYELFRRHNGAKPLLAVGMFPAPLERALKIDADGMLRWLHPENRFLHSQNCIKAYYDAAAFLFVSREHLYADRQGVLEEFLPLVLPSWKAVDINDPQDMEVAELLYLGRRARDGA